MSITFKILNDEQIEIRDECLCTSYFAPDELNTPADPKCSYCGGTGELRYTTGKHDLNVTSFNARSLLSLIEPGKYDNGEEMSGEWTPDVFPKIRANIIRSINSSKTLKSASSEGYQFGNFCECGVSSDRIKMRLEELLTIVIKAGNIGSNVVFY